MANKYIIKATGEREEFDSNKLRASLARSKAKPETIENVLGQIEQELQDGASTKDIYTHAFALLRQKEKPAAISYSLRKAILDLGPTGFPFEKFVAEIFHAKGFETTTDYIAQGKCVEHEIDIVAWNADKLIMTEAKFHNELGLKSDLKVVLYVNSRWEDLKDTKFSEFGVNRKLDEGWLVTNTKFSESAIKYAQCRNMKLIGWNYPIQGNLQDLAEECELHPITCLESITPSDEKLLMESGIVLCKQAVENQDILKQVGLSNEKIEKMLAEIASIQK
jgi:hypothetical protein